METLYYTLTDRRVINGRMQQLGRVLVKLPLLFHPMYWQIYGTVSKFNLEKIRFIQNEAKEAIREFRQLKLNKLNERYFLVI